jgi:hypothetical protein
VRHLSGGKKIIFASTAMHVSVAAIAEWIDMEILSISIVDETVE